MASGKKQLGNFKVEVLDVLNTHMAQMLMGKTLSVEERTREVLVQIVKKHYRKNEMKEGGDFVMVDGKGKTVASFPTLLKGKPTLKDFVDKEFQIPAQQPFNTCDSVTKCIKAHRQQLAHMRTISSDYTFGGISKICPIPLIQGMVPVQGMCFFTMVVSLSYFIPPELDDKFAQLLEEILQLLKAWPTFETVAKIAQFIIYRIPILAHVPIPALAVDHENGLMHFCDQRGVPAGWHVLKIGMLAELANAGTMTTSKLNKYYVG
nr:HC-Pro [Cardamom mosaic virus]